MIPPSISCHDILQTSRSKRELPTLFAPRSARSDCASNLMASRCACSFSDPRAASASLTIALRCVVLFGAFGVRTYASTLKSRLWMISNGLQCLPSFSSYLVQICQRTRPTFAGPRLTVGVWPECHFGSAPGAPAWTTPFVATVG